MIWRTPTVTATCSIKAGQFQETSSGGGYRLFPLILPSISLPVIVSLTFRLLIFLPTPILHCPLNAFRRSGRACINYVQAKLRRSGFSVHGWSRFWHTVDDVHLPSAVKRWTQRKNDSQSEGTRYTNPQETRRSRKLEKTHPTGAIERLRLRSQLSRPRTCHFQCSDRVSPMRHCTVPFSVRHLPPERLPHMNRVPYVPNHNPNPNLKANPKP